MAQASELATGKNPNTLHAKGMEKAKGHLAMLLFAALISGSFSIGHIAAPHIDPVALTTMRFFLASFVMAALGIVLYGQVAIVRKSPWRFLILGALMALYFVLMFVGLRLSPPVSMGAVFTLIPLMSAMFGWFFLRQVTSPIVLVSLIIAALGALWVIFRGDVNAMLAFEVGHGESIFFIGCVAHAAYAPLVRKLNWGESIFSFSLMTLLASTLCMTLWGALSVWNTNWSDLPLIVWITICYLAVFTTAGTFFLLQFASMRLPASKVLAYGYLIPGIIVLYEGILGHGWASTNLLMGVLVTAAALVILALVTDC